jgi:hypothetical protein
VKLQQLTHGSLHLGTKTKIEEETMININLYPCFTSLFWGFNRSQEIQGKSKGKPQMKRRNAGKIPFISLKDRSMTSGLQIF